ncbi:MAG: hypothetical protein L0H94_14320 [Nitrospira sp.]|nr:hypothetical protein [Nitrospira sp.]
MRWVRRSAAARRGAGQRGVVSRTSLTYYLQNSRVRGVLLWNVWEQVEAARQLIAVPDPFTTKNLKGRLPTKPSSAKQDS